ncbi:MAG: alpha-N-arabinofuranosidase [Lachnospiraceae bacterium]|nr:alpha-N-arabinofuranosidase [Lachnospiraceae bacterium]
MHTVNMVVHKDYKIGEIDKRIYGSFVEHMGRVVYTGIYEPTHPTADSDGFRRDVIEAVKILGVTSIRYPGGNFVSSYHWEDGVGPREERPRKLELAWKSIETNEFGTNEFMKWIKKVGAEPMMAVNLGTRGLEDAVNLLEYCNFEKGTKYSNLRIAHGVENPYGVKTWCLGNEMDGPWQIGHKTAKEYGRIAEETAKAMKLVDPSIELVSCGSSLNTMTTFPQWEADSLDCTYEYVDYISLHQYFAGQQMGTGKFLAQADSMNTYIKTVISVCDFIKAKKRSDKSINISFDEWGVWAYDSSETVRQCEDADWKIAPAISEMIYTFEDSLLFAGMLLAILKNADRVKMACQSLLTNISATIMTQENGELWVQPNYYPFAQIAKYGRGVVMDIRKSNQDENLDCVCVINEKNKELVIFAINRNEEEEQALTVELQGYEGREVGVIEHSIMISEDKKQTNEINHDAVKPQSCNHTKIERGKIVSRIPTLSWNMIRVKLK